MYKNKLQNKSQVPNFLWLVTSQDNSIAICMLPTSSTSQEAPHSWYNGFFFPFSFMSTFWQSFTQS
jgi:hypothetical protein